MKKHLLTAILCLWYTQSFSQDSGDTVLYGTIEYGTIEAQDSTTSYSVPLAPGEELLGVYIAPSVIQVPLDQGVIYDTVPYTTPVEEIEIDRVTGLPRNTTGWTGSDARPAGIGCFPQGVCAHLN